jgi:hypothetical protein
MVYPIELRNIVNDYLINDENIKTTKLAVLIHLHAKMKTLSNATNLIDKVYEKFENCSKFKKYRKVSEKFPKFYIKKFYGKHKLLSAYKVAVSLGV